MTHWFRLLAALGFFAALVPIIATGPAGAQGLGPVSFKVEGATGVLSQGNELNVAFVATNASNTTARVFVSEDPGPLASDNRGHSWKASVELGVSGVYVCSGGSYCLTKYLKQTEQSATLVRPGERLTIQIHFTNSSGFRQGDKPGHLFSFAMVAFAQPVTEEFTATGSAIIGGTWSSISFGDINVALQTPN